MYTEFFRVYRKGDWKLNLFHCAILGRVTNFASIQHPNSTTSVYLFKRSPCHVPFQSLAALKHDVCLGLICSGQLQRQGRVIPWASLSSATHWATDSHGDPRLPGTEMGHCTHIEAPTHVKANVRMCSLLTSYKAAAACRAVPLQNSQLERDIIQTTRKGAIPLQLADRSITAMRRLSCNSLSTVETLQPKGKMRRWGCGVSVKLVCDGASPADTGQTHFHWLFMGQWRLAGMDCTTWSQGWEHILHYGGDYTQNNRGLCPLRFPHQESVTVRTTGHIVKYFNKTLFISSFLSSTPFTGFPSHYYYLNYRSFHLFVILVGLRGHLNVCSKCPVHSTNSGGGGLSMWAAYK